MEFWRRISKKEFGNDEIERWSNSVCNLIQSDYDFILLQEINPFYLYKKDYRHKNGPLECFNISKKNIYYHELFDILKKEKYADNDTFWGTAIIAHEKYRLLRKRKHFYDMKDEYIGSKYFGYETLMCYDFALGNDKVITAINFYKKGKAYTKDYAYDERFFIDLENIVNEVSNKNLILLAGDFNANFTTLERIEKLGFEDKAKHIKNTMVEVPKVKPYHNDCIFINNNYSKYLDTKDIKKITLGLSPEDFYKYYSDHYGIECSIKL